MDSKTRAKLRSLASTLEPVGQVGKEGVTAAVTEWVTDALRARELIKITVLKNCTDEPSDVAIALAEATGSEVVTVIGFKAVLYKKSDKQGVKHILDDGKPKRTHSEPNSRKKAAAERAERLAKKEEAARPVRTTRRPTGVRKLRERGKR